MGVMDKLLDVMKLGDADEGYYSDTDDYEDEEEEMITASKPVTISAAEEPEDTYEPKNQRNQSRSNQKVTPIRQVKRAAGNNMEVCVIKPTSVEDCREITDTLLGNRTVVLNMEGLDVDIAQRIIDFASGSTYAIQGNLQKISNYIFIITPPSVDISGDFQEIFSGTFDVPPISHTV
ncbi:MAG: cell division protein SepF [Lachnospiraceae bacterium]|nr:cell division protein SepF [Lachnospiraceae bacterium]